MRRRRHRRVSTGPVRAILLERSYLAGLLDDEPWIPVGWYVYPQVRFDGHDAHFIPQGHGTQVHIVSHPDEPPNWDGFAHLTDRMKAGIR